MGNINQVLVIMQGPSGSGKSTLSKEIAKEYENVVIFSTDDLFCDENGVYNFNPKLLGVNHQKNYERAAAALHEGKSVVIDNTNLQRWECRPYAQAAINMDIPV